MLDPELTIKQANMIAGDQIVFFNCRDLYHTPPDSGKRQYKSKT